MIALHPVETDEDTADCSRASAAPSFHGGQASAR
jgi:hypothetical protein